MYLSNYNPWHPISNPKDLKVLGKLGEEASELASCISRCIIQGITESEPVTHKPNQVWLEEEIADVLINIELVREHFGLDAALIDGRIRMKEPHLRWWHTEA